MSENKNKLQQLQEVCDSYQIDGKVAQRAIEQIESQKQAKKAPKRKTFLRLAYSCVSIVCVVAIGLAVYFGTLPAPVSYFDDTKIELVKEDDLPSVIEQNSFTAKYFKESIVKNELGVVKESGKIVYFKQTAFFATAWDDVELIAKVAKNTELEFEVEFDDCTSILSVGNNLEVKYKSSIKNELGYEKTETMANFTFEDNEYFLTIESYGTINPTDKIEQYVSLLING